MKYFVEYVESYSKTAVIEAPNKEAAMNCFNEHAEKDLNFLNVFNMSFLGGEIAGDDRTGVIDCGYVVLKFPYFSRDSAIQKI